MRGVKIPMFRVPGRTLLRLPLQQHTPAMRIHSQYNVDDDRIEEMHDSFIATTHDLIDTMKGGAAVGGRGTRGQTGRGAVAPAPTGPPPSSSSPSGGRAARQIS